ncbi:MAG: endonuclease domain-containing protein [Mycobacterium sp.]
MGEVDWPFRGVEALDAGLLTARELRRFYRPVYPGVYALRGTELSALERARAAWLWSRRRGVLAGLSAHAVLGATWIQPGLPAELIHTNQRTPPLVVVHADTLASGETQIIAGMAVTTPPRTAFDIGRRSALVEGVQRIDALMNATNLKIADIAAVTALHGGVRGLAQLRRTLTFVDGGAESPYESMTRLVLMQAGFPPLATQLDVPGRYGVTFARIDMGWPDYLVGVEFDGAHHWTDARQRTWDIDRLAKLQELGWLIVRVSSGMLHHRSRVFLERVATALLSRGCPKTW